MPEVFEPGEQEGVFGDPEFVEIQGIVPVGLEVLGRHAGIVAATKIANNLLMVAPLISG